MKRTIRRALIGLVAIALLVPMFAAFEAHVINVKAHIENALQVEPKEIDFGVVFPQERLQRDFCVGLSESFMRQERATDVAYRLVQKRKPAAYEKLDVVLAFDLTGSMADDLAAAEAEADAIIDALDAITPSLQVGVMSHVDYPGYYDYTAECGYASTYGVSPDYAYKLDAPLNADLGAAKATIGLLSTFYGGDGPQDYARIAHEAWNDPAIGWRSDAKKLVILFADDRPHDCDLGTGGDPGRDELKGTADDLDWDAELAKLSDENIALSTVHSGSYLTQWEGWTAMTGGVAIGISDPLEEIVDAIKGLLVYPDLRPFVDKVKVPDGDVVEDTENEALLDMATDDTCDEWLIDFYVPCIEGAVGQDYVGPVAPREDDYGLDIWVEVYGLSYAEAPGG